MTEFTPEWIAKARNACIFFGEPATTEFRKALDYIEHLQKRVEELEIIENKNQSTKEVARYWVQKLREEEARADLHANLNRKIANALGKKINENWSDMPEIVVQLKQRIAELEQERRWINQDKTMIAKKDGDSWCFVLPDFINLQESEAQFMDAIFGRFLDKIYIDLLPHPPKDG